MRNLLDKLRDFFWGTYYITYVILVVVMFILMIKAFFFSD